MSQDQVEEVKQKTDIVSVTGEHIDLKKAGRNYKALCPFHSEKTPSFMVSPELQIYKCFGCGEAGDVYAFLQKYEGIDFYEALKTLADRAGVKLKTTTFKDREGKQRLYELNNLASKFYQYILLKHSAGRAALNYLLKQRGLKLNTIKEFQLGYSPDRPGAITKFLLEKKSFTKQELDRAGLTYNKGGAVFDRFRGRVIFPLFDHRGSIVGFAGRLVPQKESSDLAKYINTPETVLYHKARVLYGLNKTRADIKRKEKAVVVEGELDAISSWQAGVKNVIAIKGSALTEDQGRLLSRFAKKLVLALDADLAGDTAARRGITIAENAGMEVSVARLGDFKDPDDMARKNPKEYLRALDGAIGVWDFIVESVFSRFDEKTGTGKAKISHEIIPVLSSISDKIVQAHYVEVVSKKLGIPVAAVVGQIESTEAQREKNMHKVEELARPKTKSRRELLEERLLSIAFSINPDALLDKKTPSLVTTSLAKRILEEFKKYSKRTKGFDPSVFAESLPKELVEGFADLILIDTQGPNKGASAKRKEFELIKRELQVLGIKDKLGELGMQIRDFEGKGQKVKLRKAEEKFSKLSQKLVSLEEKDFGSIIL